MCTLQAPERNTESTGIIASPEYVLDDRRQDSEGSIFSLHDPVLKGARSNLLVVNRKGKVDKISGGAKI